MSHPPGVTLTLTCEQARHLVAVLDGVDDFFYHARHRPHVTTALHRYAAACLVGDPDQAVAGMLTDVTTAADTLRTALGIYPRTLRVLFGALHRHEETR